MTTGRGFSPRLGPGYLLYVSSKGTSDGIWKLVDKTATELRSGDGLLPALMKDPELKDEFKTLITNLRQHGVLFYRDSAGKRGAAGTKETSPAPRIPRPLTGTKQ